MGKIFSSIKTYIKNRNTGGIYWILRKIYNLFRDLWIFFATVSGYIPFHFIRMVLYKWLFGIKVPFSSIIYWRARFFDPTGVVIGSNSIIGNDAFLDGRRGIAIGSNVCISAEVRIYTMEHDIFSESFASVGAPVYIEDWVYVGARVTIMPGVRIGEGSVVASGAIVAKDVAPWTMVGGVPAKFIKNRPVVKYVLDTRDKRWFQ